MSIFILVVNKGKLSVLGDKQRCSNHGYNTHHGPFNTYAKYHCSKLGHAVVMNIWNIDARQRQKYPWWRHQMETFSALLALCAGNSPVPVTSPHKGQWRGALMFSLIWTRINDWVNNREPGDLRRHRGHYDVSVMLPRQSHVISCHFQIKYIICLMVLCCYRRSLPPWYPLSNLKEITFLLPLKTFLKANSTETCMKIHRRVM